MPEDGCIETRRCGPPSSIRAFASRLDASPFVSERSWISVIDVIFSNHSRQRRKRHAVADEENQLFSQRAVAETAKAAEAPKPGPPRPQPQPKKKPQEKTSAPRRVVETTKTPPAPVLPTQPFQTSRKRFEPCRQSSENRRKAHRLLENPAGMGNESASRGTRERL